MADNSISTIRADFYIYALFRENGVPFYIGKGQRHRWLFHEWDARRGVKGHRFNIIRNMQARGVDVMKVKLHEGLTEVAAHRYEVAFIAAIGRLPDGPLVNLTDGGDGVSGGKHTAETLAKLSALKLGRKLSPESIAKRSATVRGRSPSPETREKIAAPQRGVSRRKMTPEEIARRTQSVLGSKRSAETRARMCLAQHGKKNSAEARAKMSAAHLGKKQTPEHIAKAAAARTGGKRTPEARAKMSASALRRESIRRAARVVSSTVEAL